MSTHILSGFTYTVEDIHLTCAIGIGFLYCILKIHVLAIETTQVKTSCPYSYVGVFVHTLTDLYYMLSAVNL